MSKLREEFEKQMNLSFQDIPINGVHLAYIEWLEKELTEARTKLKNNGYLGDVVGQSEQLCQCEDAPIKHFAKNWCDDCQKHIV